MDNSIACSEEPDTELLTRACDGEGEAFSQLVTRYHKHVRGYLHSRDPFMLAPDLEDLTQEVFARAWWNKLKFRREASARTFLFAIAKNVLSEHRRRRRRAHRQTRNLDIPVQQQPDGPTEVRELLSIVSLAIEELTSKQKQAFSLVLLNEVPVREAAQQAGASVKAMRRRAETARDHLRRRLSACESQCCYDCPSRRYCPAEAGEITCLKFLIRKYL